MYFMRSKLFNPNKTLKAASRPFLKFEKVTVTCGFQLFYFKFVLFVDKSIRFAFGQETCTLTLASFVPIVVLILIDPEICLHVRCP